MKLGASDAEYIVLHTTVRHRVRRALDSIDKRGSCVYTCEAAVNAASRLGRLSDLDRFRRPHTKTKSCLYQQPIIILHPASIYMPRAITWD